MTKQEIVESIAREPKYLDMCRHVTGTKGEQLAEDLYQELFVCLMEMPEEKLIRVYQDNFANFYFKMACRQYRSKSSRFFKVNIKPELFLRKKAPDIILYNHVFLTEKTNISPDLLRLFRRAMLELEQTNFVGAKLLELHADRVSIKQVAIDSNVPRRSVYKIIENARQDIRLKVARYKRMKQ